MDKEKAEALHSARHGLGFSEEAKKELIEAQRESPLVKLNILLEVCFKCRLCGVEADSSSSGTARTWDRVSDVKHHLETKHGINKQALSPAKQSATVLKRRNKKPCTRNDYSNSKEVNSHNQDPSDVNTINDFISQYQSSAYLASAEQQTETEREPKFPCEKHYTLDFDLESESQDSTCAPQSVDDNQIKQEKQLVCIEDNLDSIVSIPLEVSEDDPSGIMEGGKPHGQITKKSPHKKTGISYLRRARTCPQCEQVFDDIDSCWRHYTQLHSITDKLKDALSVIKESKCSGMKLVNCPLCGKENKDSSLLKHIILVHLWRPKLKSIRRKREMLCPKCGKAFNYEQNYYLHLRSVHGGIKQKSRARYTAKEYKCTQCDYKTCEMRRLNSHMKYAHSGIKTYSCKYCSYATWERTSLRDHLYRHKDCKPYHCEFCAYQCIQKKQLRAHLLRMHSISLPKTGHTRVPPRTGPRQIPCSVVQMADRETSTDPPPKRLKSSKSLKQQSKIQNSPSKQGNVPQVGSVSTTKDLFISDGAQMTTSSLCLGASADQQQQQQQQQQTMHYSLRGQVISQVSPSKCLPSQLSANTGSILCTFTMPSHSVDQQQQLVLPVSGGDQVQNLILPSGGQPMTPQKDLILASGIDQSSSAMIGSPQNMYMAPNLHEKTAYHIIQVPPVSDQQPTNALPNDLILNTSHKLTDTIAVTPVYTHNPQIKSQLSLSNLAQVNPGNSKGSLIYVLK